jgi:hypothetical protein
MKLDREKALMILAYLLNNKGFNFPFKIVCKGLNGSEDFVEVVPEDDYETILNNKEYDTFELWEDLQNITKETIELMSKGFLEKIKSETVNTNDDIKKVSVSAIESVENEYNIYYSKEALNKAGYSTLEEYLKIKYGNNLQLAINIYYGNCENNNLDNSIIKKIEYKEILDFIYTEDFTIEE